MEKMTIGQELAGGFRCYALWGGVVGLTVLKALLWVVGFVKRGGNEKD